MKDIPLWPLADKGLAWDTYTTGDALFRKLQAEGHSRWQPCEWVGSDWSTWKRGTLPALALWWKWNVVDKSPVAAQADVMRRWQVLSEILWCFDEARKPEESPPTEIDRLSLAARLPEFDQHGIHKYAGNPKEEARVKRVARAYMCVRSFRGTAPSRAVETPIALVDTSTAAGFMATLTLELMPGGTGEIAPHLGAAFDTIYHTAFESSLERAWKMAGGTRSTVDGRWSMRRGTPFASPSGAIALDAVDGPSAGGAAARGWWHLLNDQVPDPEVVVMMQIANDDVSFETVDFIPQKVRAVEKEGRTPDGQLAFDTIVVVGSDAKRDGESALGRSSGHVRIVPLN